MDADDLARLPKAELHLHVEGTLEPELAFELAKRNDIELPARTVEELRARYDFEDLQSFLDLYYACVAALRTREDFTALATAYLERAAAQGVRHVEMFFDAQAHTTRDVPVDTVIDGLLDAFQDAEQRFGISGGLILCFLRHLPEADALAALESVAHRSGDLLGVGLDSTEVGNPPSKFAEVYARARVLGLHTVAHAGEEASSAYIQEALSVSGYLLVRLFGAGEYERTRFREKAGAVMSLEIRQSMAGRWFLMWILMFGSIGPAFIYLVGVCLSRSLTSA